MSTTVCIVEGGAATALGLTARAAAAAARAGIGRIVDHPYMVDRAGDPYRVALVPSLEQRGRLERTVALARHAITEALDALEVPSQFAIPVFVSVCELGTDQAKSFALEVARRITAALAPRTVEVTVFAQGNAGGFRTILSGRDAVVSGRAPFCVVAGADSYIDADVLEELDDTARLACERHRWGFPPGEGAAAMVLATSTVAKGRSMRSMGELLSVELGHERQHALAEEPCTGEGLGTVLTSALSKSGTRGISRALCDLDGERYRDREYTWATQRLPPVAEFNPSNYDTLVPSLGALGGAGAIVNALTALCWAERGHFSESDILIWGGSQLGLRGAAVIRTGSPVAARLPGVVP